MVPMVALFLVLFAIGCTTAAPAPVVHTPNIDATIEAKLTQLLPAPVVHTPNIDATIEAKLTQLLPAIEATIVARVKEENPSQAKPALAAIATLTPIATVPMPIPRPAATPVPTRTPTPVPSLSVTRIPEPTSTVIPDPPPIYDPQFLLETLVTPPGMGSVSLNPANLNQRYSHGVMVRLVSTCLISFDGWSGDLPEDVNTSSRVIFVPMDQRRTITANCAAEPPEASNYTLKVNGQTPNRGQLMLFVPNGTVQFAVQPGEEGKFPAGANVTLMATPNQPNFQISWAGVDSVDGKLATVNMDRNREVELSIVNPIFPLTAISNPQGSGNVIGVGEYLSGTVVKLVATANSGWGFTGWSGDCSGSGDCIVVMDSGKNVIANFEAASATGTLVPTAIVPTPTPAPNSVPIPTPTPTIMPTPTAAPSSEISLQQEARELLAAAGYPEGFSCEYYNQPVDERVEDALKILGYEGQWAIDKELNGTECAPAPTPTPEPTEVPFSYSPISTWCRPIVTHIAEFALKSAYGYPHVDIKSEEVAYCEMDIYELATMVAIFLTDELNLDLGMLIENVGGAQSEIFGGHGAPHWSLEDVQEQNSAFEVMGFLTEGVIKVKSPDPNFPQFLYEMTFSENTLIALQDTGLKGEELAIHYYQNYEDEWMQWFTGEEESNADSLKEAASASP